MRNIRNFPVDIDNIPKFLEPVQSFAFRMQRKMSQIRMGATVMVEQKKIIKVKYSMPFSTYQSVREPDFMDSLCRFAAGEMAQELLKKKLITSRIYGRTDEDKILELSMLIISPK